MSAPPSLCSDSKPQLLLVEHFKRINDTFGHAGGEEFCVFLDHTEQKSIVQSFEQVRKEVEGTEFCFNEEKIRASVSFGIALQSREPLDETINTADTMLYQTKHAGRNGVISNQGGIG